MTSYQAQQVERESDLSGRTGANGTSAGSNGDGGRTGASSNGTSAGSNGDGTDAANENPYNGDGRRQEERWIEPFVRLDQLSDEPVEMRIPGLLTTRGTVLFSGYRKCGKTTLDFHLVNALSQGGNFLGRPCTRLTGPLVYVNLDMTENMVRQYATEQGCPLDSPDILIQNYQGIASRFQLGDPSWRYDYAQMLYDQRAAALTVDPIHPLLIGVYADSNNNDESRATLEYLGEVAHQAKLKHLIIIDHTGHADKGRTRGASGKEDWADMLWNLQGAEGQPTRTLNVIGRGVIGSASYLMGDDHQLVPCDTPASRQSPQEAQLTERVAMIKKMREQNPDITQAEVVEITKIPKSAVSRLWARTLADRSDTEPTRF